MDQIIRDFLYFPEEGPRSVNFDQVGISAQQLIPNLGFLFLTQVGYIMMAVLHVWLWLTQRITCCRCVTTFRYWLASKLYWNGLLRLVAESFMEFSLLYLVAVQVFTPLSLFPSVRVSAWYSVACFAFTLLTPIIALAFYRARISQLHEPAFMDRYGALLQDLRLQGQRQTGRGLLLMEPLLYFVRRFLFVVMAIYAAYNLTAQLLVHLALQMTQLVYVFHTRPYARNFSNRLAFFQECTTLVLLYCLMGFTDFINRAAEDGSLDEVATARLRNSTGRLYTAVIVINLMVQIGLLLRGSYHSAKLLHQRRKNKRESEQRAQLNITAAEYPSKQAQPGRLSPIPEGRESSERANPLSLRESSPKGHAIGAMEPQIILQDAWEPQQDLFIYMRGEQAIDSREQGLPLPDNTSCTQNSNMLILIDDEAGQVMSDDFLREFDRRVTANRDISLHDIYMEMCRECRTKEYQPDERI